MLLPADWDKPSSNNGELCKLFDYGEYEGNGLRLPYRLFVPETQEESVPLVVYLHGADAVGNDNESQLSIHDIGTMFARDEWQKEHPCFVVAPQYGHGQHWSVLTVREAVQTLVEGIMRGEIDVEQNQIGRERSRQAANGQIQAGWPEGGKAVYRQERIDRKRIYIYGYSAGGVGTLGFLKDYPDFYAGAISICGATGKNEMENLSQTPLWLVHAADDQIVKASYRDKSTRELAHFGSRDLYEEMKHIPNWDFHYTEYPAGWMQEHYQVNPHCSWVAVSDERGAEIREWLFAQKLEG